MPFPADLESLEASGYVFLRSVPCPVCGEIVEIFSTPGKREIVMDPMGTQLHPAVRHYETCKPKQGDENEGERNPRDTQRALGDLLQGDSGSTRRDSGTTGKAEPDAQGDAHSDAALGAGQPIPMRSVNDKNMTHCGWRDGTLEIWFRYGRYQYANVPEDIFDKISNPRQPYPNNIFTKLVKNHPELCPYTKLS